MNMILIIGICILILGILLFAIPAYLNRNETRYLPHNPNYQRPSKLWFGIRLVLLISGIGLILKIVLN
jgi:hypothetical protein